MSEALQIAGLWCGGASKPRPPHVSDPAPGLQAAAFYQYEDCPDSDEEMEVGLGSTSDAEASTMSEKHMCRAPDLDDVSSAPDGAWEAAAGKHAVSTAAGGIVLLMQDTVLCRVPLAHQKVLRVDVWLTVLCVVSWASCPALHL